MKAGIISILRAELRDDFRSERIPKEIKFLERQISEIIAQRKDFDKNRAISLIRSKRERRKYK